ncbi:MAG: hypothetical protein ABSE63_14250 [Thermoguttaceae bacterium]
MATNLKESIRTIGALVTIAIGIMFLLGNPYQLPQWVMLLTGVIIILLALAVLVFDYKPWRWLISPPLTSPNADQQDIEILLGEWSVTKPDLNQKWIFSPARTVISDKGRMLTKGIWQLEKSYVHIEWDSLNPSTQKHHWAKLNRPLNPEGTRGDAWDRQTIYAVKIPAGTDGQAENKSN